MDQASHNDGEVDPPAEDTAAGEDASAEAPTPNDPSDANASEPDPNEDQPPVAEGSREWGAERLSAMEADALAESFRPSWETDWGGGGESPAPAADANLDAAASAIAAAPAAKAFDQPTPALVAEPAAAPAAAPAPSSSSADDTDHIPALIPGEGAAKRNLLIGAGVFVLAIVVIMGFMLAGGEETPETAITNAPSESDPALAEEAAERAEAIVEDEPEVEPEVAPPEPEPEPEPVTYQLTVRTEPASATLTLDGETVANPLTRTVEADEAEHQLVAQAEGYEQATATVRFDGDHDTVLTLEAEPPPAPVAMAEPPPARMRSTRRTRRTATRRTAAMRETRMRSRGAGFTTSNPY